MLSWPPHDAPPSSEIAQYMPCSSLPSQKFSEACTIQLCKVQVKVVQPSKSGRAGASQ